MFDYEKAYSIAVEVIERKDNELDFIRLGLMDLKYRIDWKGVEEVDEFIDNLIDYRDRL